MNLNDIRNFCIIAHIDAGKSTLADRFLEITKTVEARNMQAQFLDSLELERERGITIKMAPVRMVYTPAVSDRIQTVTDSKASGDFLYEELTYKIRGAVFSVRKQLGLGHKENIYHKALEIEFRNVGLKFESEKIIDVFYEGEKVGVYKPDFVVEDKILIELKALPLIGSQEEKQVWNYLKGTRYKLALLINFGYKEAAINRIVDTKKIQQLSASGQRSSAQVEYVLNLIDTPGHPDFGYEVSRAFKTVEGAILLVDASKGIQAQTLANFEMAKKSGLKIIGAVNKIDLNLPQTESIIKETAQLLQCPESEIFKISGRTGQGVEEILKEVIEQVPAPSVKGNGKSALIFDSLYDDHKGIIAFVRVFNGEFKAFQETKLVGAGIKFKAKEVGYFSPRLKASDSIETGEIGYIATGIKDPDKLKIGDTIGEESLIGYEFPQPRVFVSFFPEENDDYEELRKSFQKLRLTDPALKLDPDSNEVLGRGFKVGFLGKLHFEITSQRLEKEFNIKTVNSFPSVSYKVKLSQHKDYSFIDNPKDLANEYDEIWEPMINLEIIAPSSYLGSILKLKDPFRMGDMDTQNIGDRILIKTTMPLMELITDFDDKLKSVSHGFASFSYDMGQYQRADLIKIDVLIAGDLVVGLSRIIPKKDLDYEARQMAGRLKDLLPKQQFTQAIQIVVGSRVIARETIPAMKKLLGSFGKTGGDRTRKMKLWKKQKEGKKKLLSMAKVNVSAEVFKELLKK